MYMNVYVRICTYMFVAYQCSHSLKRINNVVGWSKPCVGQRVSQSLFNRATGSWGRRRRGRWIRSCTQCPAAPPAAGRQIQVHSRVSQSCNLKFTPGRAMQGTDGAVYDALSARRIQVHTMMPAAGHSVPFGPG
jgi:hypothetical protein